MTTALYYKRKQEGLCTMCGIALPYGYSYVKCSACIEKEKDQRHERWLLKQNEERKKPPVTKPKAKPKPLVSLDEMAIAAKAQGVSYGKLQQTETAERIEKYGKTLKGWGR